MTEIEAKKPLVRFMQDYANGQCSDDELGEVLSTPIYRTLIYARVNNVTVKLQELDPGNTKPIVMFKVWRDTELLLQTPMFLAAKSMFWTTCQKELDQVV